MKRLEFPEAVQVFRTDDWAGIKKHLDRGGQVRFRVLIYSGLLCCLVGIACVIASLSVLGATIFSLLFFGESMTWGLLARRGITLVLLWALTIAMSEISSEIDGEINTLFRETLANLRRKKQDADIDRHPKQKTDQCRSLDSSTTELTGR